MTNLLITFLNAPRGDRKRYDTLTVMASVLQLTDEQKEQVGLIRRAGGGVGSGSAGSIPGSPGWVTPGPRKSGELDYPAEVGNCGNLLKRACEQAVVYEFSRDERVSVANCRRLFVE